MKKFHYSLLAAMFAMALVVAAPGTAITSHAMGFNPDAPHDDSGCEGNPWDDYNDHGSSDSGSSNSGSSDSGSSDSGSSDSGSHDSGSHDSGSHDSGSSDSGSSDNGGSYDAGSSDNGGSSDDGGSSAPVPEKNPNDMTVEVAGGQPFRIVMNGDHTAYDIFHCGIKKGTVTAKDTEGNPVAYQAVTLEQGEDKLWYVNVTFAEGVDTNKLNVTLGTECAAYLAKELGVSGLKVNGTVVLSTAVLKK